jgi:hypothetical protein
VAVRTTHGGPAPSETTRAIGESSRSLERDRESWLLRRERLAAAEAKLAARVKAL